MTRHLLLLCAALAVVSLAPLGCTADTPAVSATATTPPADAAMSDREIITLMSRVADWQIAHPSKHRRTDWTMGALYTGMFRWARLSPDNKYMEWVLATGDALKWECSPKPRFHADEHVVGQTYLDCFKLFRRPDMLAGTKKTMDDVVDNQPDIGTEWGVKGCTQRWNWCDALFMAPPTLTRLYSVTGDERYLDWALKEYKKTTGYLWDDENSLYFRDGSYFPPEKGGKKLEKNGKKVFWARGNGWVFAGLANLIPDLPADHASRDYYVGIFKKMAASLVKLQQPDGSWHASLLDPASYPIAETSGTAFFTYGLAWGVNQGLLDRATYLPAIEKGWARLASCVHPDGKLGYVQPIGADPQKVTADMTEVYGVGGFLLAGTEIWRMRVEGLATHRAEHALVNTETAPARKSVTLRLADIGLSANAPVLVLDGATSVILPSQVADGALTIVAPLGAKQTVRCVILQGEKLSGIGSGYVNAEPCFGRHVPERKDDFAWENDRTAHRVYGPALEHTKGEHFSNGIDVWSKKTGAPVIDAWYKSGHYHSDHGTGMDQYEVGGVAGCGGTALLVDGALIHGKDWTAQRLIESGPARVVFELDYAPFPYAGVKVVETKRFTLERFSNFTEVTSRFKVTGASKVTLAIALQLHTGLPVETKTGKNFAAAWERAPKASDGFIGTGITLVGDRPTRVTTIAGKDFQEHPLSQLALLTDIVDGDTVTYRLGATWSAKKDFTSADEWFAETGRAAGTGR